VGQIDKGGKESKPIPIAGAVAAEDGKRSAGGDTMFVLLFFGN